MILLTLVMKISLNYSLITRKFIRFWFSLENWFTLNDWFSLNNLGTLLSMEWPACLEMSLRLNSLKWQTSSRVSKVITTAFNVNRIEKFKSLEASPRNKYNWSYKNKPSRFEYTEKVDRKINTKPKRALYSLKSRSVRASASYQPKRSQNSHPKSSILSPKKVSKWWVINKPKVQNPNEHIRAFSQSNRKNVDLKACRINFISLNTHILW